VTGNTGGRGHKINQSDGGNLNDDNYGGKRADNGRGETNGGGSPEKKKLKRTTSLV
jgi:hypothetical protein